MKLFALPVVKTTTTMGHVLVKAESAESAKSQLNQEQLKELFKGHFTNTYIYEVENWNAACEQLFGPQGTAHN